MDRMSAVSIVFFSHLKGKGYKAPRLREYFPSFYDAGLSAEFFGLLPKPEPEEFPQGLVRYEGSRLSSAVSTYGGKLGGFFGASSLGRYLGCQILSHAAVSRGCLEKSSVVFTQPYMWPLVQKAKRKGIPVVLESDSDFPLFNWKIVEERHRVAGIPLTKRDPWNFWPYVAMTLRSIDAADRIIVFSEHAYRTYVEGGISEKKLMVASPPPHPSCEVVSEIGRVPEFIWSGNHGVRKGLDLVVAAWDAYQRAGGKGYLHVCGEITPAQVDLRRRLAALPQVTDHGRISFIKFLKQRRRVLLSPSFSEGLPRTVMEALACGSSAIVSEASSGGFVEHGRTGWIVALDHRSLLAAMQAAESEWSRVPEMGNLAATRVLERTRGYFDTVARAVAEVAAGKSKEKGFSLC